MSLYPGLATWVEHCAVVGSVYSGAFVHDPTSTSPMGAIGLAATYFSRLGFSAPANHSTDPTSSEDT